MQEPFLIKKVAVLGAGVMGAQIAAHCVNAGIETLLFDLAATEGQRSGIVDKAIKQLKQLKPTPLATPETGDILKTCNYDEHLSELSSCDLIIEAIAERLDWKEALYHRITPYLTDTSILVTNTSGLCINELASVLPENHRKRFCGVHFFNPPRYMHLAELIPSEQTSSMLLDDLEAWLTSYLGKGVVRAKDTPNFIANRIGVFSLLITMHYADKIGIGFDEVDALTGVLLGRPKSATFRTMDVVGLDTMQHVVKTMEEHLTDDPWHALFKLPKWLVDLIDQKHLGQKTGQGIYRKKGSTIEVFDPKQGEYCVAKGEVTEEIKDIMKCKDASERMQRLIASSHPQAKFLVACYRDLFHYCAYHLAAIAENVRDVDFAIRWGFGWKLGPFETWQMAGLSNMKQCIENGIQSQETSSSAPLPQWLMALQAFYTERGAYAPDISNYQGPSQLSVYKKQYFPETVLCQPRPSMNVLFEDEGVCLWSLQDDVAVVHFKTKANTIGQSVLDGLNQALDIAEKTSQGLIVYQHDENNFSSGADLRGVASLIQAHRMNDLSSMIEAFQQLALRFKYSPIPTVAALRGRALGGGCELMMQCSAVVAAFESYPGLVEVGVGLIPAGGGCKEMAMRAASTSSLNHLMTLLQKYFEQIATALVATSATDALKMAYLQDRDTKVMNAHEVLYAAVAKIRAMRAANYMPPLKTRFQVAGREGHARLQTGLVNWLEGGFISKHDYFLANQLAYVMCGGDVNQGQWVDEAWMLHLEKEAFITLAETSLTQARIATLLETGKPLRN